MALGIAHPSGHEKRRRIVTQRRRIGNLVRASALLAPLLMAHEAYAQANQVDQDKALRLLVQAPFQRSGVPSAASADVATELAAWLSSRVQRPVRGALTRDALSHWALVRQGVSHDVVLEEAHFTAYRVTRYGFRVLARAVDEARFAVVVAPGTLVSVLDDLRTRRVAVSPPPALAALRILELFTPAHLAPVLVTPAPGESATDWVLNGAAAAAVINASAGLAFEGLRAVLFTDTSPGPGVSVSPSVDAATAQALGRALLTLGSARADGELLKKLAISGFALASNETYDGAERVLRATWGYRDSAQP